MATTEAASLYEQADAAYAEQRPEEALRTYLALMENNEDDPYPWYRSATLLAAMGDRDVALASLRLVPRVLAESGQLLLALAALRDLRELDAESAAVQLSAIAALYASGSERVDRGHRTPPPPPSRQSPPAAAAMEAEGRALREMAREACDTAAQKWQSRSDMANRRVPFHPLLSDLSSTDLEALFPLLKLHVKPAKSVVVEQGEEGSSLFIVVRGLVEVRRDDVHLAFLRSGAFFGEMALLTRSPRAARVACEQATALFELDRDALEELARSPDVAGVLAAHTRQRLLRNLMATSPLFRPLDPQRRNGLISLFTSRVYGRGETVVTEGQSAEGLYVVLSGEVHVSKHEDGGDLALAELGPGQVFGEISLIQQKVATATVTVPDKAVVLCLPRAAFNDHVSEFPEVLAHVYKLAVDRERANLQAREAEPLPVDQDSLLI